MTDTFRARPGDVSHSPSNPAATRALFVSSECTLPLSHSSSSRSPNNCMYYFLHFRVCTVPWQHACPHSAADLTTSRLFKFTAHLEKKKKNQKNQRGLKTAYQILKKEKPDSNSKPACSIPWSKNVFYKRNSFLGSPCQHINAGHYEIDLRSGRFSMCPETRPWPLLLHIVKMTGLLSYAQWLWTCPELLNL